MHRWPKKSKAWCQTCGSDVGVVAVSQLQLLALVEPGDLGRGVAAQLQRDGHGVRLHSVLHVLLVQAGELRGLSCKVGIPHSSVSHPLPKRDYFVTV